jgi:NADPH:quinone reductase-like Zn-dependent oxidoreductase
MRAVTLDAFDAAPAVRDDLPDPTAAAGGMVVRVRASSVNPVDNAIAAGMLREMVDHDFPVVLGRDYAGTVEAIGPDLDGYAVGDEVFGFLLHANPTVHEGSWAELIALTPEMQVAPKPASLDLATAGVAPLAGIAALAAVDALALSEGVTILTIGATGGVGSFAIQLAALRGAEVWTTCSAKNADWCRALGAYKTIDYLKQNFTAPGQIFDAVLDTIGGPVHRASSEVLKPNGKLVYLNADPVQPVLRKDVSVLPTDVRATQKRLLAVLTLIAQGKLKAQIGARFPLSRAADAYELSRTGHARGKILLIPGIL